jgi:hypothetical protein
MASPQAHHFLLSSHPAHHPSPLLAPPTSILSLQHKPAAATNKGRSKLVGRVSTNGAGRSYIGENNKCSLQVRAVSVDGDAEKKEADVKKPTSYRPVVILPVSDVHQVSRLVQTCCHFALLVASWMPNSRSQSRVSELSIKNR